VSATPNTEIVRDLITHFFNAHDVEVAERYFAPDLKWHGGLVGDVDGVRTYAGRMRGFFAALPDVRATEQDAFESGDRVCMRFVVEGTHEGGLWGLPPTGRRVRWDAIMIYRIQDGKVVEQWAAEDWTAIVHAVGDYTPPWLRT
jgi:predicted ester cyclase